MDASSRRPRVAVVFGGRSSEHAISCITAGSVLQAIDPARYDVVPVGIAPDGQWVLESGDPGRLAISGSGGLPEVDTTRATVVLANRDGAGHLVAQDAASVPETLGAVDVVFPLLHGPWGEDGTIQGMLEMVGVRYVGAGVLASAVGMDKHVMKILLQAQGLPVLPHVLITARDWSADRAACREMVEALGYPVFVKPCRGGSSIGISKVHDHAELDAAIEEAQAHDPRVLVEAAAVGGREVECGVVEKLDPVSGQGYDQAHPGHGDEQDRLEGVLDGAGAQASVVAEVVVGADHEFYDFAAKYLPEEKTELTIPADLPPEVARRVQELAVSAFEVLSCEGLARVDFFVLPDGRVVINEINTMPGFTPSSMFPRMWAASGMDYPALVDRLLQLALRRGTGLR
jgi:D-alanine-D-alanine ligase